MKSGWIISPPPGRHLPAALNILNKALAGRRAPVSRHELSLADTSRAATADWSCRLVELALPAIVISSCNPCWIVSVTTER